MRKVFATLLMLFLIGISLWHAIAKSEDKPVGLAIGNVAPDFELNTIEGKSIRLSELRGKKVIVNFWATWCPPCREEMPAMQKFYEQYNEHVEVLAVNLTSQDSREKIKPFVEEYGLTFPVVLDVKGKVLKMYEIEPIPTTYIIDSKGIIREKIIGSMTFNQMVKLTEK